MRCIEHHSSVAARALGAACTVGALALAGCGSSPSGPMAPALNRPAAASPAAAPSGGGHALTAPAAPRSVEQLRLQAAHRLVAANPGMTFAGPVPEVLLAIPVLEVELNADGSVRNIAVLRYPRQAKDTTQLAIDAVRRAAPYGDVSRLPRPWKFTETFLFNDDRKFKPRTLVS